MPPQNTLEQPSLPGEKPHHDAHQKTSKLSRLSKFFFKQKRLNLIIFIVIFGGIGVYFLIRSFAATPTYTYTRNDFGIATGSAWITNEANIDKSLNDFLTLRVRYIRTSFPWKSFQAKDPSTLLTGQSKYNWKDEDYLIAELKKPQYAGKFNIIATIGNPPEWAYAKPNVPATPCTTQPPFNIQAFADASRDFAAHMYGTVNLFEVENSPNIADGPITDVTWNVPNPCGYTQSLKKVYSEIHSVRPLSQVLVGGLGGVKTTSTRIAADEFLLDIYQQGAKGYFDGVAYHAYNVPYLPCAPTAPICTFDPNPDKTDIYGLYDGFNRMIRAHNIMVALGDGNKKIFITENGAYTSLGIDTQVGILTAIYQRASQFDWVATTCWYRYQDDTAGGLGWGLEDSTGVFKPALLQAYTNLTKQVPTTP